MNEKGNQRMDRIDWMDKIEWTGTHIYKNASSITYIVNYYPTPTQEKNDYIKPFIMHAVHKIRKNSPTTLNTHKQTNKQTTPLLLHNKKNM